MADATLLQALTSKLLSDPAVSAAFASSGGLWLDGPPEDETSLPTLTVTDHDEVPLWNSGGILSEDGRFKLIVTGYQPLSGVEALAGLVKTLLDPDPVKTTGARVELTISGVPLCYIERQDYQVRRVKQRGAAGSYVFQVVMPYRAYMLK